MLLAHQAVLEILERGVFQVALVFLVLMVCQDPLALSLCCLLDSVLEVTLDKRDLLYQHRRPRCKPSCSRPGWLCAVLQVQWV